MKYFCISDDRDVLVGMRLAGICGVLALDAKEVEEAVRSACADRSIAILLVTESCHALCGPLLDEIKLSAERPLVNVISGSRRTSRAPDSITRLINEAIGVKI
ncbi:MAG: V-type ATP synthase subunit F [Oscillospiraceae bacterium]